MARRLHVTSLGRGAIPPLSVTTRSDGSREVSVNEAALAAFCLSAGLPEPPPVNSMEGEAFQLIHSAISEAATARSADAIGKLGGAYEGNGFLDRALSCYEQAVELDARSPRWWHLLGEVQLARGDGDAALGAFTRASALDPQNAAALALRGNVLIERGEFAEAEECYRRYVQLRSNDPLGHFARGKIALGAGDAARARAHLEEAIKYAPRYPQAHLLLGRALDRLGDAAGAQRSFEAAAAYRNERPPIFADPIHAEVLRSANSTMALQKMMLVHTQAGRQAEAYKLAQQIVARRPDDYTNHRNLGVLADQTGRRGEALEHFRRAVSINPRYVEGHVSLARALRDREQNEAALEAVETAIALDPGNATAASLRASLLQKLGRQER
jgi:tetratricopeptide (TPR) repeat protein